MSQSAKGGPLVILASVLVLTLCSVCCVGGFLGLFFVGGATWTAPTPPPTWVNAGAGSVDLEVSQIKKNDDGSWSVTLQSQASGDDRVLSLSILSNAIRSTAVRVQPRIVTSQTIVDDSFTVQFEIDPFEIVDDPDDSVFLDIYYTMQFETLDPIAGRMVAPHYQQKAIELIVTPPGTDNLPEFR